MAGMSSRSSGLRTRFRRLPSVSDEPNLDDWRALASQELTGADGETLVWHTPEGLEVKPLYTADDLAGS
jgi:methylmalonyl-CoA mutase